MKPLANKVALVTGASRGVGRGIAVELGEAGATVYITGRPVEKKERILNTLQLGTIEQTALEVNSFHCFSLHFTPTYHSTRRGDVKLI